MNKLLCKSIVFAMVLCLLVSSCKKKESDFTKEKNQIEAYLNTKGKSIVPTSSGLYYETITEGTGLTPALTDYIIFNYKVYNLSGTLLESSRKTDSDSALITPVAIFDGPLKLYMNNITSTGLLEGLQKMKEGGKVRMYMPSALTYGDNIIRIFEVELIKVVSNPITYERTLLDAYLQSQNINKADSLSTGIYYTETLAGNGETILAGDSIQISYSLSFTDGRLIYSNGSFGFKVGNTSIIQGFSLSVEQMRVGGKAITVIPYYRGYGSSLRYDYYSGEIVCLPYTSLVLDVEVVTLFSK
jgi:FKBP-type peptidyl-prolyl cis-trans isomerase FkpA